MAILFAFTANMLVGGWLALEGSLSIGAYSIIVFITQRLLWPLTRLGQTFDLYQRAMASTDRVLNLLDTPVGLVEGDIELKDTKGEINFDSIEFSYPERESVLSGVSLTSSRRDHWPRWKYRVWKTTLVGLYASTTLCKVRSVSMEMMSRI